MTVHSLNTDRVKQLLGELRPERSGLIITRPLKHPVKWCKIHDGFENAPGCEPIANLIAEHEKERRVEAEYNRRMSEQIQKIVSKALTSGEEIHCARCGEICGTDLTIAMIPEPMTGSGTTVSAKASAVWVHTGCRS